MALPIVAAIDIAFPQHMHVGVTDAKVSNKKLRMTIYTGTASFVVHAGDSRVSLDVLVPLVGLVDSGGRHQVAILRVIPALFRGAVATASLASLRTTDDDTINAIDAAQADLHRVTLFPSGVEIDAVVLIARVVAQRSDVNRMGYQVTVLSEQLEDSEVHIVGETDANNNVLWNGQYPFVGPVIVPNGNGVPVR